jgi:hypothetical protein
MFGRSVRRGTVLAVLLGMALVTTAAAAIIIRNVNPFTGNVLVKSPPTIMSLMVNDNGIAEGSPNCPGWDCSEGTALGLDPISLKADVDPYVEAREDVNLAACTATIDGDHVHLSWTDTYPEAYCALFMNFRNNTNKELKWKGATVTGAPVDVVAQPACGSRVIAANQTGVAFVVQLKPQANASGSWTDATLDIDWIFAGSGVCP